MKPQERKEKWERHPGKKPRESENCLSAEPSENGHNNDAGSSGRETDRGKERVKKKIPLRPHKRVGQGLIFQPYCGWCLGLLCCFGRDARENGRRQIEPFVGKPCEEV